MPSRRSLAPGVAALAVLCLSGVAAAQSPNAGTGLGLGARIAIRFVTALVVSLLLGGGLVALAPDYADSMVAALREDPGGAFGWGLVAGLVVPILLALLAATIIGLIVTIPGLILLFFLGIAGNAVSVVWLGTVLAGDGDAIGGRAIGVGALAFALLAALPVLGNFLTSVVGLFGLGVVSRDLYRSRRD